MKILNILENLGKEEINFSATTSRRETIYNAVTKSGKVILAAALPAGVLMSSKANGQTVARGADAVLGVLQFALGLEYLEATFYDTAMTTTGFTALMGTDQAVFSQIRKHEDAHVTLLAGAITSLYGASNVPPRPVASAYDWTGHGAVPDPFLTLNYGVFLALSQAFEDTGVRAYKGQAGTLQGSSVLTTALQIHSVEARHACEVRRIRGQKGWITQATTDISIAGPNYGAGNPSANFPAENNTIQGGIDVSAGTFASLGITSDAATESFDEPLDSTTVTTLVTPFYH